MKAFSYNRLLLLAIFLGMLASGWISWQRSIVEKQTMTVDLAIDYEGLLELAEHEGLPPEVVLKKAKEAGITSLAVYETTFKKLNVNGKAAATPGSVILERYHSGALQSPGWRALVEAGRIIGTEVYVTGHHQQTFREVKEDLIRRLGKDRVQPLNVDGSEVLAVKANYKALEKMNIGMPTDEMKAVNEAGFNVIVRPSNYTMVTPDDVDAVFKRLDGIKVSEMVFSGKEVLGAGNPKALERTAQLMKERGYVLGLIEETTQLQFYKQEGNIDLAQKLDYDIVRLYSISKGEMEKLPMATFVERWGNTCEERNIRIAFLHIFEKPLVGKSLLETNLQYFTQTRDILLRKGFALGKAGQFHSFEVSRAMRALVVVGVVAGCVLYLSLILPWLNQRPRYQLILFALLAALAAAPVLLGYGGKIRLLSSLAAANVFPALAVIWQLDRVRALADERPDWSWPRLAVTGYVALLVTGALSYVGAAYLSGSLSDVQYFLEFNIFRGIKLTFILPLILVAVAFLQRFDVFDGAMDYSEGVMEQVKRILDMPIKVKTLVVLFGVLVAAIIFVARSGHTMGMPVSSLELRFRAFLEQAMYARPRSKELLIGHPAFLLAALAWFKKWPTMVLFALVMVATIGQGSMVETFAHMRTPFVMSFARGIGGIVLGGLIGIGAMAAVELWQCVLARAKEYSAK